MRYYYFAQFNPDEEAPGVINVIFPDMPGCVTFGHGLEKAFEAAQDALTGYIEVELDRGETLPPPSDYVTAKAKGEAELQELGLTSSAETVYLLVPVEPQMDPPVRVNLSMNPRVLASIDAQAKAEGMTRSGFIAVAAKTYITDLNR